jgi:hypothetical protein
MKQDLWVVQLDRWVTKYGHCHGTRDVRNSGDDMEVFKEARTR